MGEQSSDAEREEGAVDSPTADAEIPHGAGSEAVLDVVPPHEKLGDVGD